MKSKIAEKIYNETPDTAKEDVRNYANLIVENNRLKTELAEVKRFLQELYHSGNKVVPELWRVRMQKFVR